MIVNRCGFGWKRQNKLASLDRDILRLNVVVAKRVVGLINFHDWCWGVFGSQVIRQGVKCVAEGVFGSHETGLSSNWWDGLAHHELGLGFGVFGSQDPWLSQLFSDQQMFNLKFGRFRYRKGRCAIMLHLFTRRLCFILSLLVDLILIRWFNFIHLLALLLDLSQLFKLFCFDYLQLIVTILVGVCTLRHELDNQTPSRQLIQKLLPAPGWLLVALRL